MGIGTKDVKTGGGLPKTIQPGENLLKINGIKLQRFPFMEADQGYFIVLDVETKPIEGFEGFFIDKDNEAAGRYEGQIGQVKTNRYYYKDGTTKSGIEIARDMEILKQIKNICISCDAVKWFDSVDGKFNTIEELVDAFIAVAPYKDKFFKMTVAGKEFERDNGYMGYDLFFPKLSRGKVAFEAEDADPSKLLEYDAEKHFIKAEKKEADPEFGNADPADPAATGVADIPVGDAAPEFEL